MWVSKRQQKEENPLHCFMNFGKLRNDVKPPFQSNIHFSFLVFFPRDCICIGNDLPPMVGHQKSPGHLCRLSQLFPLRVWRTCQTLPLRLRVGPKRLVAKNAYPRFPCQVWRPNFAKKLSNVALHEWLEILQFSGKPPFLSRIILTHLLNSAVLSGRTVADPSPSGAGIKGMPAPN